ncbi:hypothetical protein DY218_15805 [Streptomyces triticagri]|uniref:Uncharacterized protein n=1 Tax=Streptomyces triticagri TaxID=2293568 RepID=A0A372M606_9ACTN|nr:hypothetical protein [Streptomyces triticagri]RFU85727.1 hypothetical protein DY218_15805 [Streptomyces triticagri]
MPTPYGSRGGMAFSADELRVLRRALALALHPDPAGAFDESAAKDCLRLADSLDEAVSEGARLRAFLFADLARYRAALPGTASGYLELLAESLDADYVPGPDDLAALRALRGNPAAAALLERCQALAEDTVRARLAGRSVPLPRARLLALPGGLQGAERPTPDKRPAPPPRPVPTPAEVFPPKRRPAPPAPPERTEPPQKLAAV